MDNPATHEQVCLNLVSVEFQVLARLDVANSSLESNRCMIAYVAGGLAKHVHVKDILL